MIGGLETMKIKVFSYSSLDTLIHKMSGLSKLICFLLLTTAIMVTYDIRIIVGIMIFSYVMMMISQIRFSQIKMMLIYVAIFLVFNFILTFLFAPKYGVDIYGTEHILVSLPGNYDITAEQLFYQITKTAKYLSVIPLGIIFILTTNPSEFASSLNKIGVSYKICTSLSLTLRYFPDVANDYNTISLAQQARGLEMSKKAKTSDRIKNVAAILVPLIMTTMDRIDIISNAMDLRGFGKHKKRTWYAAKPLKLVDYVGMLICVFIFVLTFWVRIYVNKSIYYNPFI